MNDKITIIYVYRNLDTLRVKRSLNSLKNQTSDKFEVIFVDYGSNEYYSNEVKKIIKKTAKVRYIYADTSYLPWNRSHAINIGVLNTRTEYFFTSDVDMIYTDNFVFKLNKLKKENTVITFRVAFLDKKNKNWVNTNPKHFKVDAISGDRSNGMSLFHKRNIIDIGLFDEKFVYWGGEDNDVIHRLKAINVKFMFYEGNVLAYHQWHLKFTKNLNVFPVAIHKHLRGKSNQLFQKNRKRGTILNYNYSNFVHYSVEAFRYKISQELNEYLFNTNNKQISIEIIIDKRDNRYEEGKLFMLKNMLNKYLNKYRLKVDWVDNKSQLFYRKEIKPYIFDLVLLNYDRLDLVGILEKKNSIVFYFINIK